MKFEMINPMPVPKVVTPAQVSGKTQGNNVLSDQQESFPDLLAGNENPATLLSELLQNGADVPVDDLEGTENPLEESLIETDQLPTEIISKTALAADPLNITVIDSEDPVLLPLSPSGADKILPDEQVLTEEDPDILHPLPATQQSASVMPVASLLAERVVEQPVIARAATDLLSGTSKLNSDLQVMKAELIRRQASQNAGPVVSNPIGTGREAGPKPLAGLPAAGQPVNQLPPGPAIPQAQNGLSTLPGVLSQMNNSVAGAGHLGASLSEAVSSIRGAEVSQLMPDKPNGLMVTRSEGQVPFQPAMTASQLPDFITREVSVELRSQSRGPDMVATNNANGAPTNLKRIEVQLVPKNLGVVEISVQKDANGIRIMVRAETAEAERIISSERSAIQEAMRNAGLNLDEMRVVSMSAADREQAMRGGKSFDQGYSQEQFDGSLQQPDHGESDQPQKENEVPDQVLNANQDPKNGEADYGRRPGIYL